MTFDHPDAALDDIIGKARRRLYNYRANGHKDSLFVRSLMGEFVHQTKDSPGAVLMALSVYRLVNMQDQITKLEDALDMRDKALELMFKLSDEGTECD